MKNKQEVDLTDIIASGDLHHIIEVLMELEERGYEKLYWDGYDSSIVALGDEKND